MKSNFLLTVFALMMLAFGGVLYIVLMVPPAEYFLYLVLFLLFTFFSLFFSIIFYKFSSPLGHESDRKRYRRQFRIGIFIGAILIVLLILQRYFDII